MEFYHIIRLKIKLIIENYIIIVKCSSNYRIKIEKKNYPESKLNKVNTYIVDYKLLNK